METAPAKNIAAAPPSRRKVWPWLLLIVLLVFWFGHEPVLVWGTRNALDYLGPKLGVRFEVGSMRLHLFHPIEFRNVRFRVTNPRASVTSVEVGDMSLGTNSLWQILFGDGRVFRDLTVDGIDGTFDFRRAAMIVQPMPSLTRAQQEQVSALILRFLPQRLHVVSGSAVFLADGQSYTIKGLEGNFDEAASGRLSVESVLIEAGSIHQEIAGGSAVTAWKDGAMYLSDLKLRDEIVLRDFVADFVNVGGISLDWDLGAYGGTLRGNVVFGEEDHQLRLDATMAIVNLPVRSIPDLIALPARTDGIIRDARLTFRGNPDHPLDNEISLRVSADNFRWNERGWQSLVAGMNYIGRRLYVTAFDLTQANNRIAASGELTVPEQFGDLPRTHYVANLSADVRDLSALAALAGPPFEKLGGQLYLHGALQGDHGQLRGYLNGEASGIRYASLPPAFARVSMTAQDDELQVPYAELWAGNDRLEAKGSIGIHGPHRYAGEVQGHINDLGVYMPFAGQAVAKNVFSGAATIDWQGDGTVTANSGAFNVTLDHMRTSATPTGLTGEFTGTYSPQNIYFKTVRLTHGALDLNSQLTISSSGVNVTGLSLKRGKLGLLNGDGFVPLNIFALSSGASLAHALATDQPVYASFASGDLPVADLIEMAGQKANFHGQLRLHLGASGTLPKLQLDGQLTGRELSATIENFTVPQTSVDIALGTGQGTLSAKGSIQTRGFQPMTLDGRIPFAYEETGDGGIRLVRRDAPIAAQLTFPRTSLEIFRPFLPTARRLVGTLAGTVGIDGKLDAPHFHGEAALADGDIELSTDLPQINALSGKIQIDTSHVVIESLHGEIGAGPFDITGGADIADPKNPNLHLQLKGTKVLLARDPGLRVRANLDLTASGHPDAGSVTGSVELVDSRIFKRLEVTPLLVPNPAGGPLFVPPNFSGLVPDPWARWKLDVSIKNGEPFLLMGNLANGDIAPDLKLLGTLGTPYLDGIVTLTNLQAYLPASNLIIPEGKIYFAQQNPFMPVLDVRATSEVSGYNVQLVAFGSINEPTLTLRSDPPLSQENLIFLLTTGLTPSGMSGTGLGEAAAGQGGIILLRSMARQLEPLGINLNDFVNRLNVRVQPPKDSSQSSSLLSELHLTDSFSLTTGRDGYGFYNAGVQYTIRLR